MEQVFCTACGQKIAAVARFCPHCGAPQTQAATPASANAGMPPPAAAVSPAPSAPAAPLPDGVKGWSWGAFWLHAIWAIGNKVWIGLLGFVPIVNFVMPFVLGFKGREWAWQKGTWRDVEHFRAVQKKWDIAGWIVLAIALLIGIGAAVLEDRMQRASREKAAIIFDPEPESRQDAPLMPSQSQRAEAERAFRETLEREGNMTLAEGEGEMEGEFEIGPYLVETLRERRGDAVADRVELFLRDEEAYLARCLQDAGWRQIARNAGVPANEFGDFVRYNCDRHLGKLKSCLKRKSSEAIAQCLEKELVGGVSAS